MIVQFEPTIDEQKKEDVIQQIASYGYKTTAVRTQVGEYLVGIGKKAFDVRQIGHLPGIKDIHIVSDDYKLVSGKWKVDHTTIDLGDDVKIGANDFAIMAGPCSI